MKKEALQVKIIRSEKKSDQDKSIPDNDEKKQVSIKPNDGEHSKAKKKESSQS